MRNAERALLTFLAKHAKLDSSLRAAAEQVMMSHKLSAAEALCEGGFLDEAVIVQVFCDTLHLTCVPLDGAAPQLTKPLDRDRRMRQSNSPLDAAGPTTFPHRACRGGRV